VIESFPVSLKKFFVGPEVKALVAFPGIVPPDLIQEPEEIEVQGFNFHQIECLKYKKMPNRLLKKSLSTSGRHSCGSRNPGFPVKTGTQSFGWFPTFVGTTPGLRLSPE
jgi:hypothetical protein